MAMDYWDSKSNTIVYDKMYLIARHKMGKETDPAKKVLRILKKILEFNQDFDTGFVTISVKHKSPYIAKEWTNLIVNQINDFFRTNDKREALAAMDFLNTQMAQTSYTEIKEVIAQLLQNKMQQLTLIEANDFYVFSYLDPPKVMEEKISPNRRSISILELF